MVKADARVFLVVESERANQIKVVESIVYVKGYMNETGPK